MFNRLFSPAAVVLAIFASRANAGDFAVKLELNQGSQKQSAQSQNQAALPRSASERPSMDSTAGTTCVISYKVSSTARDLIKDALVHLFVVRIEKPGEAPPPLDPKKVLMESALTMDFSIGGSTHADLELKPSEPGIYLVRVEAQNPATEQDPQAFAAIDLIVK